MRVCVIMSMQMGLSRLLALGLRLCIGTIDSSIIRVGIIGNIQRRRRLWRVSPHVLWWHLCCRRTLGSSSTSLPVGRAWRKDREIKCELHRDLLARMGLGERLGKERLKDLPESRQSWALAGWDERHMCRHRLRLGRGLLGLRRLRRNPWSIVRLCDGWN